MGTSLKKIWIVGSNRLQNELFGLQLEERFECCCHFVPLQAVESGELQHYPQPALILVDGSVMSEPCLCQLPGGAVTLDFDTFAMNTENSAADFLPGRPAGPGNAS